MLNGIDAFVSAAERSEKVDFVEDAGEINLTMRSNSEAHVMIPDEFQKAGIRIIDRADISQTQRA